MYLGFYFCSGVVRPTDQEKTAIEKRVCFHSPRGGGLPHYAGPHGEAPGLVSRQREQVWARAFIVVSVGKAKQGRVSRFRIVLIISACSGL